MRRLHKSLIMPYRVDQIYTIVADVSAYPQFLPWCGGARILKKEGDRVEAEITIEKGPVKVAFSTLNQLTINERIDMNLAKGPFKQLTGGWQFETVDNHSCRVTLALDFEFNNRLLAMTVGSVFELVIGSLIDAFLIRAKELYGNQ